MLQPRLTNCKDCAEIQPLIDEIDCALAKFGGKVYNNITLMLNQTVPFSAIADLLHYKRILQYKLSNYKYAEQFTVNMIASRVKLLKYKK